ncbi:MAG: hypothetical protein WDN10_05175 [bacterium]
MISDEDIVKLKREFAPVFAGREEFLEVKADVGVLKVDVSVLKTDVAVLKTDVAELKTDTATLKTDVAELKVDVSILKTDVADLKVEVGEIADKMDTLLTMTDKIVGGLEHERMENAAGNEILFRHTRQIQELAQKTGTALSE